MTQVSRRPLSKRTEQQLLTLFFKSFAGLSNSSDIEKFLSDLLGPSERTMLAKRLAIALLLAKGYHYDSIKDILKVSQETIARVNLVLNVRGEGYNLVVRRAMRDENLKALYEKVENAIIGITPNSSVKRAMERDQKSNRKPKTPLG